MWSLLGTIIYRILMMFAAVLVAKLLGNELFGQYGFVKSTCLSLAIFCCFSFNNSITKFITRNKLIDQEKIEVYYFIVISSTFIISITIITVLLTNLNYFSLILLKYANFSQSLKIMSIWIFFTAIVTTQQGIITSFKKFKKLAYVNILSALFCVILTFFLLKSHGMNGALFSLAISQIVAFFCNYLIIKNLIQLKYFSFFKVKQQFIELYKFTLPLAAQDIVFAFFTWFNFFIFIKLYSYGELGLFNSAYILVAILIFVPSVIKKVFLVHLFETHEINSKNRVFYNMLKINFIAVLFISIAIYSISSYFLNFLGKSFVGTDDLIIILLVSAILMTLNDTYMQYFLSKSRPYILLYTRMLFQISLILN